MAAAGLFQLQMQVCSREGRSERDTALEAIRPFLPEYGVLDRFPPSNDDQALHEMTQSLHENEMLEFFLVVA